MKLKHFCHVNECNFFMQISLIYMLNFLYGTWTTGKVKKRASISESKNIIQRICPVHFFFKLPDYSSLVLIKRKKVYLVIFPKCPSSTKTPITLFIKQIRKKGRYFFLTEPLITQSHGGESTIFNFFSLA